MVIRMSTTPSLCSRGRFRLRIGIWHFRLMETTGGVKNRSGKFGKIGNHSNNRRKRNMFFSTNTRLHPHNRGWSIEFQHRGEYQAMSKMMNWRMKGQKKWWKTQSTQNQLVRADSDGWGLWYFAKYQSPQWAQNHTARETLSSQDPYP